MPSLFATCCQLARDSVVDCSANSVILSKVMQYSLLGNLLSNGRYTQSWNLTSELSEILTMKSTSWKTNRAFSQKSSSRAQRTIICGLHLLWWSCRKDGRRGETTAWADRDESQESRRADLHDLFTRSEASADALDSVVHCFSLCFLHWQSPRLLKE